MLQLWRTTTTTTTPRCQKPAKSLIWLGSSEEEHWDQDDEQEEAQDDARSQAAGTKFLQHEVSPLKGLC